MNLISGGNVWVYRRCLRTTVRVQALTEWYCANHRAGKRELCYKRTLWHPQRHSRCRIISYFNHNRLLLISVQQL